MGESELKVFSSFFIPKILNVVTAPSTQSMCENDVSKPLYHNLSLMLPGIIIIIILEYEEKLHRSENLEGTRHEGCAHHSGTS